MKDSSPLYGYVDVYQWRGCHWIDEFLHLYSLRRFKILVYWEFKPWDRKSRLVFDSPSSFHKWKTSLFFVSSDGWETIPSESSDDALKLLRSWGTPVPDVSFICFSRVWWCSSCLRYWCLCSLLCRFYLVPFEEVISQLFGEGQGIRWQRFWFWSAHFSAISFCSFSWTKTF